MRIPTLTLALLAAALSGSVGARLAKSPKAAAVPGPAYLAARDYTGDVHAHKDIQKRQAPAVDLDPADAAGAVTGATGSAGGVTSGLGGSTGTAASSDDA